MTPRELIKIAQERNPEGFEKDPANTLHNTLVYLEAVAIVADRTRSKMAAKPAPAPSNNDSPKSLIAELADHYQHRAANMREIADGLGVSGSTIALWLKGKTKPTGDKLGRIRAFLDQHNRE